MSLALTNIYFVSFTFVFKFYFFFFQISQANDISVQSYGSYGMYSQSMLLLVLKKDLSIVSVFKCLPLENQHKSYLLEAQIKTCDCVDCLYNIEKGYLGG